MDDENELGFPYLAFDPKEIYGDKPMMLDNDWLNFYRKWTYDRLLQEVLTCHLYQLSIVERLSLRHVSFEQAIGQIRQSQQRENLINEVIREKVHDKKVV